MEWKIKKFQELSLDELYAILAVRTDVFVVEQECPYPEVDGRDQASYHLCAWEDGVLLAYARILPPGLSFEEASIGRVLVRKEQRGRGLAQQLLKMALTFVTEDLGEQKIQISAQTYLTAFYESYGFQSVSETYLEDGIPHRDMIWTAK